jgi:sodium transport system permease protein
MNWQTVRVIFSNEIRMMLRDRRAIIIAVVLPLLIWPVMFYALKRTSENREKNLAATVYKYVVTGSQAEPVRKLITRGAASSARQEERGKGAKDNLSDFKFQEVRMPDPAAGLKAAEIHFYLEGLSGAETDALPRESDPKPLEADAGAPKSKAPDQAATPPLRLPGVPLIRIFFQGDRDASQGGSSRMQELLLRARRMERDELLLQHGLSIKPEQVMPVRETSVASAAQVTGSYLGRFLTLYLMLFLLTGGSIVALDSIAGEKERGSLETLLTTAARRGEIVAAKQLVIVAVALVITIIQIGNILAYVTFKVIKLPSDWVIEAPPATIATLLLLFIPLAAFTASILLMLSAFAKSYKEAQLYFFPVYLLSWVPALAAVLPGISLRSAIILVPLANVAGGPALFPRHVLRWYALMGVALFAVALNVPQLSSFRAQLLFNELVLFLGIPLLMIRKYRLNVRDALALRPVKPLVWFAVLLAIPAGNLTTVGVFRLANLVFPVPQRMLEQFGRELMPESIPLWQLILFAAILPGICEEVAFRGTLLFGLRRKLRPLPLAVSVGLIFGFFHVALFRIIPTAFMGMMLTAMALLTGSIFPGMLVHAGNNALGLWMGKMEISAGNLAWWWYLAAAAVLALAFYILYRARTPYPGLRP